MPPKFKPHLDPRLRLRLRIDVEPRWKGGVPVPMETIDLSACGAACRSPICLPLKTQVSVILHLPPAPGRAAHELKCEAVVVNTEEIGHSREEWRAGIYFLNLKESDREILRRFIFTVMEESSAPQETYAAQG